MTQMPRDQDNNAIQTLRLRTDGAHSIAATTGASARNASAFSEGVKVVSLYATQDMYLRFGGNTAVAAATDSFFPKGLWYDFAIDGAKGTTAFTHVAARAVSSAGTLYISERD